MGGQAAGQAYVHRMGGGGESAGPAKKKNFFQKVFSFSQKVFDIISLLFYAKLMMSCSLSVLSAAALVCRTVRASAL